MIRKPKKPAPRSPVTKDGDIGTIIRKRRKELKISQNDLGKALGVSFQQIQKYEKGANRVGANRLADIAKVLKMAPEAFYAGAGAVLPDVESIIDVSSKDTVRMLRAFRSIKDQATQRTMVVMIEAIADSQAA